MNEIHRIGDHRRKARCAHVEILGSNRIAIERQLIEDFGEDRVFLFERNVELLTEDFRIEKILHTQTNTRCLIGIGRANTALGRADLVLAKATFGELVEFLVVREDQMCVAADLEL